MNKFKKNLFGLSALALVIACLVGLWGTTENGGGNFSADAQQTAGYSTRIYRQVPADALTGTTGAEALGYLYGFNGTTWDRMRVANVFKSVALAAGTTETTIWTPQSGKKFRLMGFCLTAGAATTLTFKDNTAGS